MASVDDEPLFEIEQHSDSIGDAVSTVCAKCFRAAEGGELEKGDIISSHSLSVQAHSGHSVRRAPGVKETEIQGHLFVIHLAEKFVDRKRARQFRKDAFRRDISVVPSIKSQRCLMCPYLGPVCARYIAECLASIRQVVQESPFHVHQSKLFRKIDSEFREEIGADGRLHSELISGEV